MPELTVSSLHRYSNRFLRSTDLVRDFEDPHGLQGYWLTDFGQSCIQRLSDGIRPMSGHRAWRLTGDFGSGKSSFALFLANSLRDAKRRLPNRLYKQLVHQLPEAKKLQYVPVLVTGNRERIAPAILRAVFRSFGTLFSRGAPSGLEIEIQKALSSSKLSDAVVLELIRKANFKIIQSGKGNGMLIILDEVGKFLEFAAQNPEQQDIYFLQQLAEIACRSGEQPIMVVCLLHQGFNAYAEQLAESSQREWEKISGRFEEIIFQQPLDQIAVLIASALNIDTSRLPARYKKQASESLNQAISLGWFGTSSSRETLRRVAHLLFPLDPMVLPALVRTFQRFGQNERSLFSFLCSYEPCGLRAFSTTPLDTTQSIFRLADFYNYIRMNFGHRLAVASYRTHWNVIESLIETRPGDDVLKLEVLKTVGVLNLLNSEDLRPTKGAISWAIGGNSPAKRAQTSRALKDLASERVLHYRGEARGYSIWAYTSVDIDARYEEAKRAIPQIKAVTTAIREQLDMRPIVARAHYIKTGNLRYFTVIYCQPHELKEQAVAPQTSHADGVILVPLCETKRDSDAARIAAAESPGRDDLILITAVPRPLNSLHQAALDAQRWEWVQENTSELNTDPLARDEVSLHLQEARNRLQNQLQEFIGLNRIGGRTTLSWYYKGININLKNGRDVMRWLSNLCDDVFHDAPLIRNELVNRHSLSAAASAARIRLIDLMFASSDKPDLGIPADRKPPEKSMYFSVLKATGLHRKVKDHWKIGYPSPRYESNLAPALHAIKRSISSQPDTRVPVNELLKTLRRPPFGVRDGLFPILLAVVAIADEREIAFYEDGTFLREVGRDAFLRMSKAPERFDIQYCRVEGVRSQLFTQLVQILELAASRPNEFELLGVVRKLCEFVAKLPDYTRNTKRLTTTALAVREVILQARQPVHLLFHDLPAACGFPKFEIGSTISTKNTREFATKLKAALDELKIAFFELHNRISGALSNTFGYTDFPVSSYRPKLATRAERLLVDITEIKLRGFSIRLAEAGLSNSDWLESVGSFLALRPPGRWTDTEEDIFDRELSSFAGRFKRAESAGFAATPGTCGMRIAVTQANGFERQEVLHIDEKEDKTLKQLEAEIGQLIMRNKRIGIAAASRVLWAQMTPDGEEK